MERAHLGWWVVSVGGGESSTLAEGSSLASGPGHRHTETGWVTNPTTEPCASPGNNPSAYATSLSQTLGFQRAGSRACIQKEKGKEKSGVDGTGL